MGVSKIHSIVNSAVKIIGAKRDENNEVLLETIESLEQALHQNHYLIMGLKEIIIQRLMRNIRKKTGNLIESYSLRTKMFDHVARVLHMVDSEGTDWLNKLQKVKDEEQQHRKSLQMKCEN